MENQYLKTKENYNSNNYDLTLLSEIPPNIQRGDSEDIYEEIIDLIPLSKRIHMSLKRNEHIHRAKYVFKTKIEIKVK